MLGPQPNLAKNAVLTHRPGELRLDNAFTLIEGHQASDGVRNAMAKLENQIAPSGQTLTDAYSTLNPPRPRACYGAINVK